MAPTPSLVPNFSYDVNRVVISDEEFQSGITNPETLQAAIHEVQVNGFLCMENAISHDTIDAIRCRMLEDHQKMLKWDKIQFNMGSNMTNLSQVPPLIDELFVEEIYSNRHMMAVIENLIGPKPQLCMVTSNIEIPSKKTNGRQAVHSDAYTDLLPFPFAMEVFIYLDDVGPVNGATEIWAGTHIYGEKYHLPTGRGWINKTALNRRAKVSPPFQPTIPKGTICVRDLRLWHSGMPNTSEDVRIMLALIYFPSWYGCHMQIILPEEVHEKVEGWRADLLTKTRFEKAPLEYLKNEGKMNAQTPLNFCQDESKGLVAWRVTVDTRDGREPNMTIPITKNNYWEETKSSIPNKRRSKGKKVIKGSKTSKTTGKRNRERKGKKY